MACVTGISMDIQRVLADLREQRDRVEEAIVAFERIARRQVPRRGRPPKWLMEKKKSDTVKQHRDVNRSVQ
jgi:hypothetical protein